MSESTISYLATRDSRVAMSPWAWREAEAMFTRGQRFHGGGVQTLSVHGVPLVIDRLVSPRQWYPVVRV